jgi:vancomycin aglycone glucosyltransferase
MRILLSTIGSRGDVQPLVALAIQLKDRGQEARICAPPDFREWVEGFDIPFVPIGPEVRATAKSDPAVARTPPTPEQIKQMMEGTVVTQFETIPKAAEGCDLIVAANALQIAARSVAEHMRIGYVFVAYCPVTLPSPRHAPPAVMAWKPKDAAADNLTLWAEDAERWTERWAPALNKNRRSLGLTPVTDVRSHIFTDNPWLAADPVLGPWPEGGDLDVFQPGAWTLPDHRPLPPEIERFLDGGEPPVYFGFGSARTPPDLSKAIIEAARALGRRAIVSRGWADLAPLDNERDCLSIGEVNVQALFSRVAAVVHHGGAGTTAAAARAGAPQVVIPQMYDQHYWAQRVQELGIGTAHAAGAANAESLRIALERTLNSQIKAAAQFIAASVRTDGTEAAVQRLIRGALGPL